MIINLWLLNNTFDSKSISIIRVCAMIVTALFALTYQPFHSIFLSLQISRFGLSISHTVTKLHRPYMQPNSILGRVLQAPLGSGSTL